MIGLLKETMFTQIGRSLGRGLDCFGLIVTSLFVSLIILNLRGIIPYVFRTTRPLLVSITFGLPIWLSLVVSGFFYSPASAVAALLPAGAPAGLNPFLVLVETVRIVVRPITLSVRLAANIRAGHIVLGLAGNFLSALCFVSMSALVLALVQVGYTIFEFGICAIQRYIFCLLLTLYSDEHPH